MGMSFPENGVAHSGGWDLNPDVSAYFFLTFYFELILDLEKSCKHSTEFPYIPVQLSLKSTSYVTVVQVSNPENQCWPGYSELN